MENANFKILYDGIFLAFDGCTLVRAEYEEGLEEIKFGKDWFIDESGETVEIVTEEDERHPHDIDDSSTLYAYIKIDESVLKKLEIFEYANGTLYLEPDDNND